MREIYFYIKNLYLKKKFFLLKKHNPFIFLILLINLLTNFEISKVHSSSEIIIDKIGLDYLETNKDDLYILGPGDELFIRFLEPFSQNIYKSSYESLENKLFGINKFNVDGDGYLLLPRISKVYVEGLTKSELKILLEKKYIEFLKKPMIDISLSKYKPIDVYIEGEILNPGLYTLPGQGILPRTSDLPNEINFRKNKFEFNDFGNDSFSKDAIFPKLFNLIQLSGGITINSDLSNIKVIRNNPLSKGGGKIEANINFLKVLESDDQTQNIRLLDGDRIIIRRSEIELEQQLAKALKSNLNPKFLEVIVAGRVENAGKLTVDRASTLNEAIDLAGGLKVIRGPVQLTRYKPDGKIDKRKFAYSPKAKRGSYKNPYLKTGDIILVGKGPLIKTGEVINEITNPFLGIYTTYSILDDIFK